MSLAKASVSALGKLLMIGTFAATFLFGMGVVVYMALQGEEIKVPDLVGKDLNVSEDELASLGLKIKRRAERFSDQKQNTILEQLPKPGETVKTGQMILVVVSKQNPNGVVPDTIKKDDEEDDIEKIEELISDKPKKSANSDNANKKKSSKTRDVVTNSSTGDSDKNSTDKKSTDSAEKPVTADDKKAAGDDKTITPKPSEKPSDKKNDAKKPPVQPADGGTRPRKTP